HNPTSGRGTMDEEMGIPAAGVEAAKGEGHGIAEASSMGEAEAEALALSGSRSVTLADRLAEQGALCQPRPQDAAARDRCVMAAVEALKAIGPQTGMEGLLASQMVAAHNIALTLTAEAFHGAAAKEAELFLRQGLRAMGVYMRQMETMARQRGRRRQSLR